jgi:hypothetical protein
MQAHRVSHLLLANIDFDIGHPPSVNPKIREVREVNTRGLLHDRLQFMGVQLRRRLHRDPLAGLTARGLVAAHRFDLTPIQHQLTCWVHRYLCIRASARHLKGSEAFVHLDERFREAL